MDTILGFFFVIIVLGGVVALVFDKPRGPEPRGLASWASKAFSKRKRK